MPLEAATIDQARRAYAALERRLESAERLASVLQAALADASPRGIAAPIGLIDHNTQEIIVNLTQANQSLQDQLRAAIATRAELALQRAIECFALAVALGEATMPGYAVTSLSASIQSHFALDNEIPGLRFFEPGVGADPARLSTTTLQLQAVPPAPTEPLPQRLYSILQEKQAVYADPYWGRLQAGASSPSAVAADLIILVQTVLMNTGLWSFPYVAAAAVAIGARERDLAAVAGPAGEFQAAVDQMLVLATSLSQKVAPVVGDLVALTASMSRVTDAARALLS